jgi:sugar diacid utilization regulator
MSANRLPRGSVSTKRAIEATLGDVRASLLVKHVGTELARNRWLFDPALSESCSPRTRNTEVAATLMALFEALFDIRKAAKVLHIHSNTMLYRLSRIEALTGLDLADADVCLSAWLQLRAMTEPASVVSESSRSQGV